MLSFTDEETEAHRKWLTHFVDFLPPIHSYSLPKQILCNSTKTCDSTLVSQSVRGASCYIILVVATTNLIFTVCQDVYAEYIQLMICVNLHDDISRQVLLLSPLMYENIKAQWGQFSAPGREAVSASDPGWVGMDVCRVRLPGLPPPSKLELNQT